MDIAAVLECSLETVSTVDVRNKFYILFTWNDSRQ